MSSKTGDLQKTGCLRGVVPDRYAVALGSLHLSEVGRVGVLQPKNNVCVPMVDQQYCFA